jgi:hypothetical protein
MYPPVVQFEARERHVRAHVAEIRAHRAAAARRARSQAAVSTPSSASRPWYRSMLASLIPS